MEYRYVESGQHKKIKLRQGLDEIIDDPCKLNESLNNIQDPQEQVSPNDNIQEFQAHMSESDIEHIILQPAIYSSRPEACTKFDSSNFNRSIRMPSNDLNNGATTNQVNDHKSGESAAESIRGSSEFEISAVQLSESPSGVHNISDCQLTRSQSSHWNKECANMPVWGQVKNEILSGTALGHILTSTDAAVNKSGNVWGKMNMKRVVSSKCGDDNLDNERRVRGRIDQPVRIKGASDTFIRGNSRALRPTSGKDRHSKVNTSKGPRDRRVRLSVPTAVQFYDVQDRLGYDQPSKAVEWLMKEAKVAIDELWQLPFTTSTENSSKTNLADSSLHESSHNQVSSTLASSFSDTLTPPAPALLRSISQFGRYCSQSNAAIHEECDAQSLNEKSDISKQIITGASIGENSELHTTERVNSHVQTELKNKSKGEAKESVEENHVISRDNSSQMHSSISASASFGGYQLHRTPPLNTSYLFAKDIQTSLVNYTQEPAHRPWQFISNGTHQERSEGLGTLSQSHAYTPIQGPYPQDFDFSYDKHQQSAEEVIIQNPVYKASNNSQISAGNGFEKYGAISSNILSHSKINTCSCTTTCSKVLSSYRDDNSMSRTPSISQFCPVTNSAERTPAMHYFSDQTFKNPTINTLLPLNPCTLSSSNSALLKQKLNLEGLQLQGVMRTSPNWHSGSNLDQNTFLRLPSRISTSSSILPPYLINNSSEDVPAIPRMLSSSRESNSFTLIDHNDVLPSSKHTRPSPLFLRSQFPTRIQGFDELHDVMERPPQ